MLDNNKIFSFFYWIFILVVLLFLHSSHQLNADDGVVLNGAWNLINDRKLYLDFFSFIPPASFYLVYVVWKIFGVSFWSAQIASILIFFLAIIGIHKISQEIYSCKYNYLIPLFVSLNTPWFWLINHNIYNSACLVWAAYFLLLGLKKGTAKYFIFSGLATGLSVLFLQQKGLALLGAINIFLLFLVVKQKISFRILLIYDFFFLLPLTVLFFWPYRLIYYSLVSFPLFNYVDSNRISYFLFIFSFLIFLMVCWFFRKEKKIEIWFLLFVQFCLLLSSSILPDFYHIFLMLFPLFSLGPLIFKNISQDHPADRRYYLIPAVIILLIFGCSLIGTVKLLQEVYPKQLIETLKNNCPGQYLYVGPFAPGLYFETGKLNATPFDILITGQQTPTQFALARQSLEVNKPECVVLVYIASLQRFKYNQDNSVDNYIVSNYSLMANNYNLSDVYVYKRKK